MTICSFALIRGGVVVVVDKQQFCEENYFYHLLVLLKQLNYLSKLFFDTYTYVSHSFGDMKANSTG